MRIPLQQLEQVISYVGKVPMKQKVAKFSNKIGKEPIKIKDKLLFMPDQYAITKGGKIAKSNDNWEPYLEDTVRKRTKIKKIFDNYSNAMHRRRDYTWSGLKQHISDDFYALKDPQSDSLLIQAFGNKDFPLFHPSHFSPDSLRGGQRVINMAARSSKPIIFTVTEDLAPMLQKSGFIKIAETPMLFNGEYVNKIVLANKAVSKNKDSIIKYFQNKNNYNRYEQLGEQLIKSPEFDNYIKLIDQAPNPPSIEYNRFLVNNPTQKFKLSDLIPIKQTGGNIYQIDSSMPQISQRYISLLNRGIKPQAAFDTAHLSLVEDGRPGKYYSFGRRASNLKGWTDNTTDSLTVGRYRNLQNVQNFNQFKQGLRKKNYNSRPAFYNTEMNRNRNKDKQIVNKWNKEHGIDLIAQLYSQDNNYV